MIAPDEALPTRANIRIPIIISQFYGLIHPTVTVSQVRRLRRPQMGSKAFYSTGLASGHDHKCNDNINNSQSDCVCKVYETAICEDPWRAEARNDNLQILFWITQLFSVLGAK
jgi:hypothetical protein